MSSPARSTLLQQVACTASYRKHHELLGLMVKVIETSYRLIWITYQVAVRTALVNYFLYDIEKTNWSSPLKTALTFK